MQTGDRTHQFSLSRSINPTDPSLDATAMRDREMGLHETATIELFDSRGMILVGAVSFAVSKTTTLLPAPNRRVLRRCGWKAEVVIGDEGGRDLRLRLLVDARVKFCNCTAALVVMASNEVSAEMEIEVMGWWDGDCKKKCQPSECETDGGNIHRARVLVSVLSCCRL